MASTFFDRIDLLIHDVGEGIIETKLVVDQVYAQNQHQSSWFKHLHGGKDHFLRDPLFEHMDANMQRTADKLLWEEGSRLTEGMIDWAEDLDKGVVEQAPREFGDLENSGHPTVTDNGEVVYDRPPRVHRLTREELRAKEDIKALRNHNLHLARRKKAGLPDLRGIAK